MDLKFIRTHLELVEQAIREKDADVDLGEVLRLDGERRRLSGEVDGLRRDRREARTSERSREVPRRVRDLEARRRGVERRLNELLLAIPNLPDPSVPLEAREIRRWGKIPEPGFRPLTYRELGERLEILDFAGGARVAGAGFVAFRGMGARLVRALIQFALDLHGERHGYVEVRPPVLANRECLIGTGHLPHMASGMYRCDGDDLFLTPSPEGPMIGMFRGEILGEEDLPARYVAHTVCFRRQIGGYGRDARGLVRTHEFDAVELVQFVRPEDASAAFEDLVGHVEEVLRTLNLAYRVMAVPVRKLSFASSKACDIEVWASGLGKYLTVSSCRYYGDFQARRMNLRFRRQPGGPSEYVHTLSAAAPGISRAMIAILENHQREDGTVEIPEVLKAYLTTNADWTACNPQSEIRR